MNSTFYTVIETNLGETSVVRSQNGLLGISIHASRQVAKENIGRQFPQSIESPDGFGDLPQRLERYAHGEQIVFKDKLDLGGATTFQRAVWDASRAIPYGETRSYQWIAQRIGKPEAARAVGQALNRNPFSIIVPCHRVIGKDGSLTGFSSGIDLKRRLIDMEASSPSKNRTH